MYSSSIPRAPDRDAPPPPGSDASTGGIEDAVAELKAALARDPDGFATDTKAKEILDRLNSEIASLYPGEDAAGGGGGAAAAYADVDGGGDDDDDEFADDDGGGEYEDDGDAGPRVELPKGPRPYDLWRAAHEVERPAKDKVVLTTGEWGALVDRLNESSRRKQGFLLRAQHQQIAAELAGLTFVPHISDKSRELAAQNKSLPQRVEALQRRKKAKLDKIRHERVEDELREATFKPDLSATKNSRPVARVSEERRRIGHLIQYEMDKRMRALQRKQLISEMESRDNTFNPAINKNSIRIVERLNKERLEESSTSFLGASGGGAGGGGAGVPSSRVSAAKKALTAALAAGLPLPLATAVTGLPQLDPRLARSLGRSYLPGHEEETFHPKINARSALIKPAGDADVYNRLYVAVTAARATKVKPSAAAAASASALAAAAAAGGPAGSAAAAAAAAVAAAEAAAYPVDEAGEPRPGHPHFFNVAPFDAAGTGAHDFILRRLVPPATLAAAAAAAAAAGR